MDVSWGDDKRGVRGVEEGKLFGMYEEESIFNRRNKQVNLPINYVMIVFVFSTQIE